MPLLSIDDVVGVIAIEGAILRKPDFFARIFFGGTSSMDIGEALREVGERDDIKAVFLNIVFMDTLSGKLEGCLVWNLRGR